MKKYTLTQSVVGFWVVTIDDEIVYESFDIEDCTDYIIGHSKGLNHD